MPESLSLVAFHFHIVISWHVFHYMNRATSSRDETKIERRAKLFFTFFLSVCCSLFSSSAYYTFFSLSLSLRYFLLFRRLVFFEIFLFEVFFFNISETSFPFSTSLLFFPFVFFFIFIAISLSSSASTFLFFFLFYFLCF